LPSILKSVPNFLYAIVGSGDEYSRLNKLVDDLEIKDHVVFIQNINDEDMIGCYQQCDFFILPNRDIGRNIEGFGIVMIEAQACGRAVISGNSGGTPESLINGETGTIVDCTSSDNISQAVIKLLVDETNVEKFRKQAREHALQFDWLKVAHNIEVACRSLNETERYLK
jgi:phosphatidylinositol alpha-1,6-mannosyltransferase